MKYYKRKDGGYSQVDETTNPSYEMYCNLNYTEITKEEYLAMQPKEENLEIPQETVELTKEETYNNRVEELIAEKYTIKQELAIQRQRAIKTKEFDEYYHYCEQCKEQAKKEIYG